MDALSSQAAVAGYKAALLAANALDKSADANDGGRHHPAPLGPDRCGVAGLQAIATVKRLGAIVEAYDVRSATKEQAPIARRNSSTPASLRKARAVTRGSPQPRRKRSSRPCSISTSQKPTPRRRWLIRGARRRESSRSAAVAAMAAGAADRRPRRRERRQLRAHGSRRDRRHAERREDLGAAQSPVRSRAPRQSQTRATC